MSSIISVSSTLLRHSQKRQAIIKINFIINTFEWHSSSYSYTADPNVCERKNENSYCTTN